MVKEMTTIGSMWTNSGKAILFPKTLIDLLLIGMMTGRSFEIVPERSEFHYF